MPRPRARSHVIANFASSLDGVVSLSPSGHSSGGEITGFDPRDRMVMGILRASADAVVIGAGTLRAVPHHLWTAEHVFPPMAEAFRAFRRRLGKPRSPLQVVVTASGELDHDLPIFRSEEVRTLIVTTPRGARRFRAVGAPSNGRLVEVGGRQRVRAREVLAALADYRPTRLALVEGGPHLIADFFGEGALDELFLTLAPRVAGRDAARPRLALVEGRAFAPERTVGARLVDVRRGGDLLFLRYAFPDGPDRAATS
jgi:riboflavin biosynthesis pyrimidine reductase